MAPTVTLGSQTRSTRLTGVDPFPARVETDLVVALPLARGTTILEESLKVLPNIAIQLPPLKNQAGTKHLHDYAALRD